MKATLISQPHTERPYVEVKSLQEGMYKEVKYTNLRDFIFFTDIGKGLYEAMKIVRRGTKIKLADRKLMENDKIWKVVIWDGKMLSITLESIRFDAWGNHPMAFYVLVQLVGNREEVQAVVTEFKGRLGRHPLENMKYELIFTKVPSRLRKAFWTKCWKDWDRLATRPDASTIVNIAHSIPGPQRFRKLRKELEVAIEEREAKAFLKEAMTKVKGMLDQGIEDVPTISFVTGISHEDVEGCLKEIIAGEGGSFEPEDEREDMEVGSKMTIQEEKVLLLNFRGISKVETMVKMLNIEEEDVEKSLDILLTAGLLNKIKMEVTDDGERYIRSEIVNKVMDGGNGPG